MRQLSIISFAIILITSISTVNIAAANLDFTGYVRNYTGVLLNADGDYSLLQNTFDLKIEHSRSDVAFKVNPYLYTYPDKENEMDLRQAYFDLYFDAVDLRIGKQQIVWGKADGVFITDVVSPKNLSRFLLPDFEEIRIGVDALKTTAYFGNNSLQLVWIPAFTPSQHPDRDSIWFVEPEFQLDYVIDDSERDVEASLVNSEVFLKFSLLSSAIDVEVMAGYFWDDNPTLHLYREIDPNTGQPRLRVVPEYHRLTMAGGSFSSDVWGMVLRGEAARYTGKYFQSKNPDLDDHVETKDYLHALLGLDFSLVGFDLSVQMIRQQILDYNPLIVQNETDDTGTLLIRRNFLRDTLTTEILCYYNAKDEDALYRPKITYDITDGFELQIGANVFSGEEGTYGQYDKNDNAYVKTTYSF